MAARWSAPGGMPRPSASRSPRLSIGTVQLIALAFPASSVVERRLLAQFRLLDELRSIRGLDVLFVHRDDASGDLIALETQGEKPGAIIGALLGFAFDNGELPAANGAAHRGGSTSGLSRADLEGLGASIQPG